MRNSKQTSARAATAASKVLRDGRTGKASKTAAASALAQRPSKKNEIIYQLSEVFYAPRSSLSSWNSASMLHAGKN